MRYLLYLLCATLMLAFSEAAAQVKTLNNTSDLVSDPPPPNGSGCTVLSEAYNSDKSTTCNLECPCTGTGGASNGPLMVNVAITLPAGSTTTCDAFSASDIETITQKSAAACSAVLSGSTLLLSM
jgi:hypothetical protein